MMRYDMKPAGGTWKEPKMEGNDVVCSIAPPTSRLDVHVRTREGYQGDEWEFVHLRS